MDVSVIGAGRVGTAMAVLLERSGHRIVAVSGREASRERASRFLPGVPFVEPVEAGMAGDLAVVAVSDDRIGELVTRLADSGAFRPGRWAAHLSGSLGLAALEPAREAGAGRFAIHPLQTFPEVEDAIDGIPKAPMAVTSDDEDGYLVGERIARDVGARPFRLNDADRPLYHAAAVFASNYLVVISAVAERLSRQVGVPDPIQAMLNMQRATLDNVERSGPADALTGPVARGDAATIERNLAALRASAPEAVPAYLELCRLAIDLAMDAGRLTQEQRASIEDVLSRWK